MANQYTTIQDSDFSGGIDARSSENQIPESYVQDLLNADIVERRARKRPGYQGYAGEIPLRATRMVYDSVAQEICFTLDSSVSLDSEVSLEAVRSSPLIIQGKSSVFETGEGPYTVDGNATRYYSGFRVPLRKQLSQGSNTLSIPASEHGIGSTSLFIKLVLATNLSGRDYQEVIPDQIRIDATTYDIEIDYTINEDSQCFVYFADKSPVVGSSYLQSSTLASSPTSQTITIGPGTHGLASFNIIPLIQEDGAEVKYVKPDYLEIDTDGTVSVGITNNTGSSVTYNIILTTAPITQAQSGNVEARSTNSVTLTGLTRPWLFSGIYLETSATGDKEQVIPDSLSYSDATQEAVIEFTNSTDVARNFTIFYDYGNLRSNELCVQDNSVTVSGEDLVPQINIYGLSHSVIYGNQKSLREGWVSHIDSYRRSQDQRIIAGLGGNLYSADPAPQLLAPISYPRISTRSATAITVAPLFHETGTLPGRTRGYITGTDSGTNWVRVTSVEYLPSSSRTRYTLEVPAMEILDSTGTPTTLSSVISVASSLEDYLTVTDMSYARHNGTFRILAVQNPSTDILYIDVDNTQNTEDYNDAGVSGSAGIFTDQLEWLTSSPYIAEDQLVSDSLQDTTLYTVVSSSGTRTVISGVLDIFGIAAGVIFTGRRTSNVIPVRTGYPNATVSTEYIVSGDMLTYTGIDRQLRVLYINPDQDRTIDITGDGEIASVELQSGSTQYLSPGSTILITQAGLYSGTHVVIDIISNTEFQFASSQVGSITGATLVGCTLEIDEQLQYQDSQADENALQIPLRWNAIESPEDTYNLTEKTKVRYLDENTYGGQPFLRSSMVQDNMYLTNQQDEVYKYDGQNNYRAGLIPWQPGAFLTQETTGATIVTDLRSVSYSAMSVGEGRLTITAATSNTIPLGSQVRLTGSSRTYTVRAYDNDGTDFYILMDRAFDSSVAATGTVAEIGTYRYYYRLNAVDANDNLIASAVTGYQDHVMELTQNAAIRHKLIGLPVWDVYDYDRLEVQIYRTKINTQAPFYKITTIPMNFDSSTGYVLFRDSFADSDLTELDEVSTALKGAELGIAWTDALRAKHITSIGNKLVLGNLRDYPELDIQLLGSADLANSSLAGDSLLFRRENTDTGTITNNVDRIKYEWVSSTTGSPGGITVNTNNFIVEGVAEELLSGDWIYLTYSTVAATARDLTLSGWWQVSQVSGSGPYDVTINYPGVGALAPTSLPDEYVLATNYRDVPVLLGVDGNLGMVNGDSFNIFDATRRMSLAINATQRMVDTTVSGMSEFKPWLVARSGNDTPPAGRLIVRQPRAESSIPELVPTFSGYDLFVNSIKRTTGAQISASTRIFPSRILVSYENYPEIFDNPSTILDQDSDSAIDINSADGQEITGVIPFFGEAAFGAAQQSAILVVFKTNSIYLVDLNQKEQGLNPVQRIETEGLGCTAPYSIAATKAGIMFANESGIYCLRRSQSIEYVGRFMERNWTERVDLDLLGLAQGHHYGVGRMYKLSVPREGTSTSTGYVENSEVFVYNHTQEAQGQLGPWSRYSNHNATGWANLGRDAFFGSTQGRVFSIRRTGSQTDFRDDNQVIEMVLDTRANSFGNPGIRKTVNDIVIDYRSPGTVTNTGTSLFYAIDTEQQYSATTPLQIDKYLQNDGINSRVNKNITSIRHSLARRKGTYFSLRIRNAGRDESVEIAGISYKVAGLSSKGILQAAETTTDS
jgi:hypothetical protein